MSGFTIIRILGITDMGFKNTFNEYPPSMSDSQHLQSELSSAESSQIQLSAAAPRSAGRSRLPARLLRWCLGRIKRFSRQLVALLSLVTVLSILAAIPGLHLLTLGLLLEAQRRVAISGRLKEGLPLLPLAPRIGRVFLTVAVCCLPVKLQASRIHHAQIILGADSEAVRNMQTMLMLLNSFLLIYLTCFILNGCRFRILLRPYRNLRGGFRSVFTSAGRKSLAESVDFVMGQLCLGRHFMLGLRAFIGGMIWLLLPTSMMVACSAPNLSGPAFAMISVAGFLLMIPVAAWLPYLQIHQAVEGRFAAVFEIKVVRQRIRQAPFSWMLTTLLLYLLTIPLYIGQIRLPAEDSLLLLTPFSVILVYPARILMGWAWFRGRGVSAPASGWWHRSLRLAMLPPLTICSGLIFLTPYISQAGRLAPYANQAYLGPVPQLFRNHFGLPSGRVPATNREQQDGQQQDNRSAD